MLRARRLHQDHPTTLFPETKLTAMHFDQANTFIESEHNFTYRNHQNLTYQSLNSSSSVRLTLKTCI